MTSVAVDTNILVRFATGDSSTERASAEALLANTQVFIPLTVLLETEWVLRSRYRYSRAQFLAFLRWLRQQAGIEFAEPEAVRDASDLHAAGFDFAAALRLATSGGRPFASFYRALLRRARLRRIKVHPME